VKVLELFDSNPHYQTTGQNWIKSELLIIWND